MSFNDELPKLGKSVWIEFYSLRMDVGSSLGACEVDTKVKRKCYRRKDKNDANGWRWIIKGYNKMPKWEENMIYEDMVALERGSQALVRIVDCDFIKELEL